MGDEIVVPASDEGQLDLELSALESGEAAEEEASTEEQLPESLKRFADDSGGIDSKKIAESYLEAEKTLRRSQNETHQLKTTVAALNAQLNLDRGGREQRTPEVLLQEFVNDPDAFIKRSVGDVVGPIQAETGKTALFARHPELRDEVFQQEVAEFVINLPPAVRALENSVEGADFLVNLYKKNKSTGTKIKSEIPPVEPPGGAPKAGSKSVSGGKVKRSSILKLMKENPQEYMRRLPDIEKAYKEGRVLKDI